MNLSEHIGLDKFLSNTTSEDNQSFNEIIKESEIQFQKKVLIVNVFFVKLLKYVFDNFCLECMVI